MVAQEVQCGKVNGSTEFLNQGIYFVAQLLKYFNLFLKIESSYEKW